MSASLNKGIYIIKQLNDETIEKIIHITEPLLQDPKNRRKRKVTKKQSKIINFPTLYSCEK
jgi:putative ubiquitin-RnfH superfamily antitoxin RatB of RatAB toxin-antitoxin module